MSLNINNVGGINPLNNGDVKPKQEDVTPQANTSCEIADSLVDKQASDAISARGRALVSLISTDTLSGVRATIKKVPLPSSYKEGVISGINAELENRFLEGNFTHKSAEESAKDIERLSPVDLGARKAELMEVYGEQYIQKKEDERIATEASRLRTRFNNTADACITLMKKMHAYLAPEDFDMDNYKKQKKLASDEIQSIRATGVETGDASEYLRKNFELFLENLSDKGLLELKNNDYGFSNNRAFGTFMEMLNGEIEIRIARGILANKSASDSADAILRLSPVDLQTRKEELMAIYGDRLIEGRQQSYLDAQLSHKSAADSAAFFDSEYHHLEARKANLEEQYGDALTAMDEQDFKPSQARKYAAVKAKFPDIPEGEAYFFATTLREEMVELVLAEDKPTFKEAWDAACEKWPPKEN